MALATFARSFATGWGAASAAVTAGPLGLFAAHLAPPWPSENGVAAAALGSAAGIIGLVGAFASSEVIRRRGRATALALAAAAVLVIVFVALWSYLVVEIPQLVGDTQVERRYLVGFFTTGLGSSTRPEDAIKMYGLRAVYSPLSLLMGRLTMILVWTLIVGLLTYGFGLQQARKPSS
jgi:hypothetical protein